MAPPGYRDKPMKKSGKKKEVAGKELTEKLPPLGYPDKPMKKSWKKKEATEKKWQSL